MCVEQSGEMYLLFHSILLFHRYVKYSYYNVYLNCTDSGKALTTVFLTKEYYIRFCQLYGIV